MCKTQIYETFRDWQRVSWSKRAQQVSMWPRTDGGTGNGILLIGRATRTGLGSMTLDFHREMKPERTLMAFRSIWRNSTGQIRSESLRSGPGGSIRWSISPARPQIVGRAFEPPGGRHDRLDDARR